MSASCRETTSAWAGVYVHWPFCERKCPYCDFYTFGREHPHNQYAESYLAALIAEIGAVQTRYGLEEPPRADTVYFGGGTPSLMGPAALDRLLAALEQAFRIEAGAEVTLEVNPTTAEAAALDDVLALGVNRLSVGCQSFNDRILSELGRLHDAATTRRALARIREIGAENVSLDLIFGAPTQTLADFEADLEAALEFGPEHFSAYNLTIHEGTPYHRRRREGKLDLPGEETQTAMFELLMDRLATMGYEHYEISNWARPGFRSRHNSKYWRDCDVFSLGASAHGVVEGQRGHNPRDLKGYLAREPGAPPEPDPTSNDDRSRRGEIMMLALRRVRGVGWPEIDAWMGADARDFYRTELDRLGDQGLIECDDASIRLTRRGILLADSVVERFF